MAARMARSEIELALEAPLDRARLARLAPSLDDSAAGHALHACLAVQAGDRAVARAIFAAAFAAGAEWRVADALAFAFAWRGFAELCARERGSDV